MRRFIGAYGALENACRRAADAAERRLHVFLNGERGVGKETLARRIAKDANRPFRSLRASRLSDEEWIRLFEERELFLGRVLYLSELERVPKAIARRLAVAAMENALPFQLVVASETPYVDLARDRNFPRETLAFVAAFPIVIPALRDRKEELPKLAQLFFDDAARKLGAWPRRVEDKEIDFLMKREWPDNLDGLRRAARLAVKRGGFAPEPARSRKRRPLPNPRRKRPRSHRSRAPPRQRRRRRKERRRRPPGDQPVHPSRKNAQTRRRLVEVSRGIVDRTPSI